jgi:hypothetical protein
MPTRPDPTDLASATADASGLRPWLTKGRRLTLRYEMALSRPRPSICMEESWRARSRSS